jgi:hypothetical protein
MSSTPLSPSYGGSAPIQVGGSTMLRYPPEPRSSLGHWATTATSAVRQVAAAAVNSGFFPDPTGDLGALLQQQIQIQLEMQVWTARSNIARSEHEIQMAPVRNMRVG